jgi:KUP system potassium uptake protein
VDASYAVHDDMKSHTGGAISFGRGTIMTKSSKQKLNTKSSTEAELVGASDYLPSSIWCKKFLEHQGYRIEQNIFNQDNQSAIRFERNGRRSCGPNSRHIDIRFFFIADRLKTDNFEVRYCPTEQMVADFFTKPLQGSLFRKLRDIILGKHHIDTLSENNEYRSAPPPSQERVGEATEPGTNLVCDDVDAQETTRVEGQKSEKPGEEIQNSNKKKGKVTFADVVRCRYPNGDTKSEISSLFREIILSVLLKGIDYFCKYPTDQ